MAYTVNNFNGAFLTTVADGTIDTTTDIRFVGKNYAGYGEIQNENFLHLMENFANVSPPPKAVIGQIWYDATSTEKKLKFWDGVNWRVAGGAKSQGTPPTGLTAGEFWWDNVSKQLYTWSGTEFVLIGPETSPDLGASAVSARVVKDTLGNPHTIVEFKAGGNTVAIVNSDDPFQLDTVQNAIPGFNPPSEIKKGITLANTGITGVTSDSHRFWGTASNSLSLGGVPASEFINLIEGNLGTNIRFSDEGYIVGSGNTDKFQLKIVDNQLILENKQGINDIVIRLGEGAVSNVAIFKNTGLIPANDITFALGSSSARWSNVFASQVTANSIAGNLIGNVGTSQSLSTIYGNVLAANGGLIINSSNNSVGNPDGTTTFRGTYLGTFGSLENPGTFIGTADSANRLSGILPSEPVPSTGSKVSIPVRDSNGNLYADQFIGTATKADTLKFDGNYYSASSVVPGGLDKRSIAARDQAGDIYATLFRGTATAARYADLAEKYLADKEYEVGTVVTVGGEAEVRASVFGDRALGVVSANPAYMMNSELEGGTYVALKGRVPVKVIGSIRKGDRLVATDNGYAIHASFHQHPDVFAIALESSNDTGVKLIEAVVL
jgi:hypothetical protein